MFTRLGSALKNWGASEGKPFLGTQALGIPVVALVFLTIRSQLTQKATILNFFNETSIPDWDWIVACLILIVYASDFIWDAITWDRAGVDFKSWQGTLAIAWILLGSFVLLGLTMGFPLLGFETRDLNGLKELLWSLRYLIFGGILYCYVKWRSGLLLAYFGPVLIAFVFASAVFGGLPSSGSLMFWIQGFCVFLLNILLMQYFEKDKDIVLKLPNLWLMRGTHKLPIVALLLIVSITIGVAINDFNGDKLGVVLLMALYGFMYFYPTVFRYGRWYRILIDIALVLWLL